jgi:hypothetical protein
MSVSDFLFISDPVRAAWLSAPDQAQKSGLQDYLPYSRKLQQAITTI